MMKNDFGARQSIGNFCKVVLDLLKQKRITNMENNKPDNANQSNNHPRSDFANAIFKEMLDNLNQNALAEQKEREERQKQAQAKKSKNLNPPH
jgi:hypothetical protein